MDKEKIASLRGHKRGILGSIDDKATIMGKNSTLLRIQNIYINVYNHVGGNFH